MSIKQMGMVWELDLPHNQAWVLMAYADHADHEGGHVYPSINMIAWKTGYSESQVHRIVADLVRKGLILPGKHRKGGRGKTVRYALNLEKGVKKAPFRPNSVMLTPITEERVSSETEKGVISAEKGVIAMTPEPSVEPSVNRTTVRAREKSEEEKAKAAAYEDSEAEWKRRYDALYSP